LREDDGDVLARALGDLAVVEAGVARQQLLAALLHLVETREIGLVVVAQAAALVVQDLLEPRAARLDLDQLVDLLLVLRHGEPRLAMVEHELHLGGNGVLVDRQRDRADRLGGDHRPVEPRAIVADDGELVAAPEAERGEAGGKRAHFVARLAPGPALPDAVLLLAHRRPAAEARRVLVEQLRKGVGARHRILPEAVVQRRREVGSGGMSATRPGIRPARPSDIGSRSGRATPSLHFSLGPRLPFFVVATG
jgi:hypothetical protein